MITDILQRKKDSLSSRSGSFIEPSDSIFQQKNNRGHSKSIAEIPEEYNEPKHKFKLGSFDYRASAPRIDSKLSRDEYIVSKISKVVPLTFD